MVSHLWPFLGILYKEQVGWKQVVSLLVILAGVYGQTGRNEQVSGQRGSIRSPTANIHLQVLIFNHNQLNFPARYQRRIFRAFLVDHRFRSQDLSDAVSLVIRRMVSACFPGTADGAVLQAIEQEPVIFKPPSFPEFKWASFISEIDTNDIFPAGNSSRPFFFLSPGRLPAERSRTGSRPYAGKIDG